MTGWAGESEAEHRSQGTGSNGGACQDVGGVEPRSRSGAFREGGGPVGCLDSKRLLYSPRLNSPERGGRVRERGRGSRPAPSPGATTPSRVRTTTGRPDADTLILRPALAGRVLEESFA